MIANETSFQQDEMGLSRVEYAYRKIKNNITTNIFPAGFQILEPELADKLGVSRTPVREALIRLEADRLIRLIPRRGMLVTALDVKEINEIVDLLQLFLNTLVTRCSSSVGSGSGDFEQILTSLSDFDTDDISAWVKAEENVFISLASTAGNHRLKAMLVNLFEQVRRAKVVTYGFEDQRAAHFEIISQLVHALKNDDSERLQALISVYLDAFVSLVSRVQEKQRLKGF